MMVTTRSLTFVLALAAGSPVLADHRVPQDHDDDPLSISAAAALVRDEAELFVQILVRDGAGPRSNYRLVYNAGLLAKEANDLALAAGGEIGDDDGWADDRNDHNDGRGGPVEQEYSELIAQWRILKSEVRYARPGLSLFAREQFHALRAAVRYLKSVYGDERDDDFDGDIIITR